MYKRQVEQAAEYDKALEGIRDQLYDAEAILNDASREISSYMGSKMCIRDSGNGKIKADLFYAKSE